MLFYSAQTTPGSSKPVVRRPFGDIKISYCQIFQRKVPDDAYYDRVDGYHLTLELLNAGRARVNNSDLYLNFDRTNKVIYVVPNATNFDSRREFEPIKLNYFIRFQNKAGTFDDDPFTLDITGVTITKKFEIDLTMNILGENIGRSDVELLYSFFSNLFKLYDKTNPRNSYYGPKDPNQILITYYAHIPDQQQLQVKYQNCTLKINEFCEVEKINQIEDIIILNGTSKGYEFKNASKSFQQEMKNHFNIKKITTKKYGVCDLKISTMASTGNQAIDDLFNDNQITNQYPGINKTLIPVNKLIVIERGYVIYKIVKNFIVPVSKKHWTNFIFENGQWYNYAVFTKKAYDESYTPNFYNNKNAIVTRFRIIDNLGKGKVNGQVRFWVTGSPPNNYYYFKMRFNNFRLVSYSSEYFSGYIHEYSVVNMYYFGDALAKVLGSKFKIYIIDFDFTQGNSGMVSWGLSVDENSRCDFSLITELQNVVYSDISNQIISRTFSQKFSSSSYAVSLNIESLTEVYQGPCKKEKPKLVNELNPLSVTFCGIYEYIIPVNTFQDNLDTPNQLKYQLLDKNMQNLELDSWITFKQLTRTVSVLLPNQLTSSQLAARNLFKVQVTNSHGLTAETDFYVEIQGGKRSITYSIQIQGFYKDMTLNPFFPISYSITNYLRTNGKNFQLILSSTTSQGLSILSFTTCTFDTTKCDLNDIQNYKLQFFDEKDQVRPNFKFLVENYYTNVVITSIYDGVCKENQAPKVGNRFSPIIVNSYQTIIYRIPENTFSDLEEGNTRNLIVKFSISPSSETIPEWISYNEYTQEFTFVAYHGGTNKEGYFLAAYDIRGEAAVYNFEIENKFSTRISHRVHMEVKLINNTIQKSFISIYAKLRSSIIQYFSDTIDTVEYISLTYPSSTYVIQWTNRTILNSVCESEKLKYMQEKMFELGKPDLEFKSALSRDGFSLEDLSFSFDGICIERPTVKVPIPELQISYCGYLRYEIPEDTFYDPVDGETRNLELTLTNLDSSNVNLEWLHFDSTLQTLFAILISQKNLANLKYEFKLHASTKRGEKNSTIVIILINGVPMKTKTAVSLDFDVNISPPIYESVALIKFLERFSQIYQIPSNNLHIYSLGEAGNNEWYSITVQECNVKNCSLEKLRNTKQDVFDDLSKQALFEPEFTIDSDIVKESRLDCGSNAPPLPGRNMSLTVKKCQTFSYTISLEAFFDEEGSENLRYVIPKINGLPFNFETSWIQMEKMTINGM